MGENWTLEHSCINVYVMLDNRSSIMRPVFAVRNNLIGKYIMRELRGFYIASVAATRSTFAGT